MNFFDISFNTNINNWQTERIYIITSFPAQTVGSEISSFFFSFKDDPEIITGRIDGSAHVLRFVPLPVLQLARPENIVTAHSQMTCSREIQSAVIMNIGESLIARGIYRRTEID